MKYLTRILIVAIFCTIALLPQKANAGEFSRLVDKGINCTAKGVYYVTKYALKGGWFVVKKGTKGAVAVSKSVFRGTKDAFNSSGSPKHVDNDDYQVDTLPPVPKL